MQLMKKVLISVEIYKTDNIRKAIIAYKNHAHIRMHIRKGYAELVFRHCLYDENETVNEFENYLIGLENMK